MRTVVLTGGSTGIGRALLDRLVEAGDWRPVILGLHAPATKADVVFFEVDLSVPEAAAAAAERVLQECDPVDVLINNAGLGYFAPIEQMPLEAWQRLLSLNVTAPFVLSRMLLPGMKARGSGRIVNISSDADDVGFAGGAAYCASKFALKGLTAALRQELQGTGVTVSTISPGRVDTNFNGKSPGDRPLALAPSDVAEAVMGVLLATDRCEIESIRLRSKLE